MEIGSPTSPTLGGGAVLPHAFLTPQKPRAAAHAGSSRTSGTPFSPHQRATSPVQSYHSGRTPQAAAIFQVQDEPMPGRSDEGIVSYAGPELTAADAASIASISKRHSKRRSYDIRNEPAGLAARQSAEYDSIPTPSHLRYQSIESTAPGSGRSEMRSSHHAHGDRKEGSMGDPLLSMRTVLTDDFNPDSAPGKRVKTRSGIDPAWATGPPNTSKRIEANDTSHGIRPPFAIRQRRYEEFAKYPLQDTKYFCGGRLLTGGDNIFPFLASIVLLLGLGGLWLGTTGVWIWRDGLGGGGAGAGGKAAVVIFGYLLGVCFGAMMATALRDPGILPRNLDPVPQTGYTASTNSLVPLSRELRVRKGEVSVKYCETCRLYRAPRSSHCRLCGNCVEGIDHHCTYLHNCIGRRNYASFVAFLVSAVLCLVYSIVFAAMHYVLLCHREGRTFVQALGVSPESGVNFVLGLVLLAPILALLGYHLHLMLINSTTVERIRYNAAQSVNPADAASNPFAYRSRLRNFAYMLCRPQHPSWIDASGWQMPDQRLPNPGSKRTN